MASDPNPQTFHHSSTTPLDLADRLRDFLAENGVESIGDFTIQMRQVSRHTADRTVVLEADVGPPTSRCVSM